MDPVTDADELTSDLVHEMFHCYQKEQGERRWPDDLRLLHPATDAAVQLKHQENQWLVRAVRAQEPTELRSCLGRVRALRDRREEIQAEVEQEYRVETVEGAAEYVGALALKVLAPEKYAAWVVEKNRRLEEPSTLLLDRRRCAWSVWAWSMTRG